MEHISHSSILENKTHSFTLFIFFYCFPSTSKKNRLIRLESHLHTADSQIKWKIESSFDYFRLTELSQSPRKCYCLLQKNDKLVACCAGVYFERLSVGP